MADRVSWLPFRILGSPCRRLDLCQMAKLLALRYMVSPHTVTPSGAHARTHARTLSNVAFFLEEKISPTVCLFKLLADLPTAVRPSCPFKLQTVLRRDAVQTGVLVVTTLLPCLYRQYVRGKKLCVSTRQHGVICRNTAVLAMVLWLVTWLGVSPSFIYNKLLYKYYSI